MMLKFLGGLFLLVGTSIGAGILALPVTASPSGFIASTGLLLVCWVFMTLTSLMVLEVNLWFPKDSNMVSMARHTLGLSGEAVAWVSFSLLLYSVLCAYIAGGADLFHSLMSFAGVTIIPQWAYIVIFTAVFGGIVTAGTTSTDHVNRWLVGLKLSAFAILTIMVIPHTTPSFLEGGSARHLSTTLMVMMTSFASAIIIPTLRDYFHGDAAILRKIILIGNFIPLVCYIAWDMAILGTLPLDGNQGLLVMLHSGHVTSDLLRALHNIINRSVVTQLASFFMSICMLTSFLGAGLSLYHFLADGFKIKKQGMGRFGVSALTFMPPLIVVLFFPGLFIRALNYAGLCCVALLILLPVAMVWYGSTRKGLVITMPWVSRRIVLGLSTLFGLVALGVGLTQV